MPFSVSSVHVHQGLFLDLALRCVAFDLVDDGVHEVTNGVAAEHLSVVNYLAEFLQVERVLGTRIFLGSDPARS